MELLQIKKLEKKEDLNSLVLGDVVNYGFGGPMAYADIVDGRRNFIQRGGLIKYKYVYTGKKPAKKKSIRELILDDGSDYVKVEIKSISIIGGNDEDIIIENGKFNVRGLSFLHEWIYSNEPRYKELDNILRNVGM
jgi:hypothetical protein